MMGCVEEKIRTGSLTSGASPNLLDEMKLLREIQDQSGTRKAVNSELWYACAGPLVSLPQVGSLVYYFPQGHSEQVTVSTRRMATSQVPNYPNLPSQLLCQVHNVTLHADKDTDEIYAQMSLQPVNSEKDVFPIPNFGLKPSNHPSEFFCKTLTASDTSTHGGFSVPRRAAEKLFPPLDYTMQPPTQELVIRDLHDNTWTFRHIYRGQPKRHLLTTGWSLFIGSKRLKAGDSVLFVRDEKSQLLVGVRRTNRQQTTLPSSVLSADSMHIGVLAAAAHAAANHSQFTIYYNPRACPSEFVIPVSKYRKAVYGTQISVGMRFGMMFETEESGKRRYMGTIIGISDLDPLRWRGSKWRNLQVEWDEPVCSDKQNRVSPWEIETPDSLFIFPSLTSGFKRPLHAGFSGGGMEWGSLIKRPLIWLPENGNVDLPYSSISNLCSEQLIKMLLKPQVFSDTGIPVNGLQGVSGAKLSSLEDGKTVQGAIKQTVQISQPHAMPMESQNYSPFFLDQSDTVAPTTADNDVPERFHSLTKNENHSPNGMCMGKLKPEPEHSTDQLSHLTSAGDCNGEKTSSSPMNLQNSGNKLVFQNPDQGNLQMQASLLQIDPLLEPLPFQTHQMNMPQVDSSTLNILPSSLDGSEWTSNPCVSLSGMYRSLGPSSTYGFQDPSGLFPEAINPSSPLMNREVWDQQLSNSKFSSQDPSSLHATGMKDLSEESQDQSGIYGSLYIDVSHGGGAVMDEFCSLKDVDFQNASDCLVGNFSSSQDVQSQITSASLADSQALSQQDFPDRSGGTSSSNLDFDKNNLLLNGPWQQVAPRVRTYTKVQKTGCVGRSIDVSSFKNYEELCSAIECMFGLEGLLNNPRDSGWKLVYVDYENDVLLIGDDPWEEFVGCVRCIRILSPSEVQQMSEEGMKLLSNANLQAIGGPSADGSHCPLAN